ncbi:MAG: BadF/BadG/BcrA/BcrD ATPase family protein, partial [Candidatus Eisenbacteria bacterium]
MATHASILTVGVDVGSISIKIAAVAAGSAGGRLDPSALAARGYRIVERESARVALSPYERHLGRPRAVAVEMLRDLFRVLPEGGVDRLVVTGSGGKPLAAVLDTGTINEFRAVATGVRFLYPGAQTILEMGGENSKYIRLSPPSGEGIGILDYETNGDCAAGTGSFMDQQATRLRYRIEDVGAVTESAARTPTIAGRCSVFAKSDMIHAQQKGYAPGEVLRGLCEAVARNYKASITKGKKIEPPVAFIGGVSANAGVVRAMRSLFDLEEKDFIVPEEHVWMAALGAALLAPESSGAEGARFRSPATVNAADAGGEETFPRSEPLSMKNVVLLRHRVKPYVFPEDGRVVDAFLGIDIGSVSTNLVALDDDDKVIMEIYERTEARPIEIVHRGLQEIEKTIGRRIRIRGAGT